MNGLPTVPASPTKPTSAAAAAGLEEGLWNSILDSVSGSKGVTTKNCIVLGNSRSGKSTLVSRLASASGEAPKPDAKSGDNARSDVQDLGLSYSVIDVRDEGDGETLARLGTYQLPSPSAPYPSLLPLALSRATLLDSLVVITLDWDRPWHFLRDLKAWMGVLDALIETTLGEGAEVQEGRERLESHLRSYAEPALPSDEPATASTSSHLADTDGPLPPGTLLTNLGLSIVFVCTKADHIATLERRGTLQEEQTDYIQQALRTVALRYGAAVFFTSRTEASSFAKLRTYILHRLFGSPSSAAAANSSASPSRSFPFTSRAVTVEREQVMVPTGWDSWNKIKILRERFDPEATGEAWQGDVEDERRRVKGVKSEEQRSRLGAVATYEQMIPDPTSRALRSDNEKNVVAAEDEQTFLKRHYEVLQKEADPRAMFRTAEPTTNGIGLGFGSSVVGPMQHSFSGLPSVGRLLERDPSDTGLRASTMDRKGSDQSRRTLSPALSSSLATPGKNLRNNTSPNLASSHLTPSVSSSGTAGATGTPGANNEVLANFFNSLLQARSTTGSPVPTSSGRLPGSSVSPTLGASARAPGMGSRSASQQSNGAAP